MVNDRMVGILAGFAVSLCLPASVPNSQLARPVLFRSRLITGLINDTCGKTIWPRNNRPRLTLSVS